MLASAIKRDMPETVSVEKIAVAGWFEMSRDFLTPLLKQRTRILHKVFTDLLLSAQHAKDMCIAA